MVRPKKSAPEQGRFAYEGLDRVIHERARLSILTSLIAHRGDLPFTALKRLCALSDGNLSRHIQVLQEAGLVDVSKGFEGKRPQTVCRITPLGRKRYLEYVEVLERVVYDAVAASRESAGLRHKLAPA